MQTEQPDEFPDWQTVNRTRRGKAAAKAPAQAAARAAPAHPPAKSARGGSALRGRSTPGAAASGKTTPQQIYAAPLAAPQQAPSVTPPSPFGSAPMTPARNIKTITPSPPTAPEKENTPSPPTAPRVHGIMRYLCPPSPTFSAFSQATTAAGTPRSITPDNGNDTDDTAVSTSADGLSTADTDALITAATLALSKVPAAATHGLLAYACSSAPLTAATIIHRATRNSEKLKTYEHRVHLTHFREVLMELLMYVGFRGAVSREPEYRVTSHVARADFVAHVRGEAKLLFELERFVTTPISPTPSKPPGSSVSLSTSTPPAFMDVDALLALLSGGDTPAAAGLTIKFLNDNVHRVTIREVSTIARKLKELGLLKGFGICIDAPGAAGHTTPATPEGVESPLSIAAVAALLTMLNTLLCVKDITALTPGELARFQDPKAPRNHSHPHHSRDTTIPFPAYLNKLKATQAYHQDPYIREVEMWGRDMYTDMMQRWADKEWQTGLFSSFRISMETMQEEMEVEKKRVAKLREEEGLEVERVKLEKVESEKAMEAKIEKDVKARVEVMEKDLKKTLEADLKKTIEADLKKTLEADLRVTLEADLRVTLKADMDAEKEQLAKEREGEILQLDMEKMESEKAMEAKIAKDVQARVEEMEKDLRVTLEADLKKTIEADLKKTIEADLRVTLKADMDTEKEQLAKKREEEILQLDMEKMESEKAMETKIEKDVKARVEFMEVDLKKTIEADLRVTLEADMDARLDAKVAAMEATMATLMKMMAASASNTVIPVATPSVTPSVLPRQGEV